MIRIRIRKHPSPGDLLALWHGELPGPERSRVLAHQRDCTQCSATAAELLRAEAELSAQLPPFPETWLEMGREALLRSARPCALDSDSLTALLGRGARKASCHMIEELLGAESVPT